MKKQLSLFIFSSFIFSILFTGCIHLNGYAPMTATEKIQKIEEIEDIPEKNLAIIKYAEAVGDSLAPTYNTAVCTEYLVKILEHFTPLTKKDKRLINIVDADTLVESIYADEARIRGVQTALVKSKKGISIEDPDMVRPGDLVQFWNVFFNVPKGHCGIVLDLVPNRYITLISSSKRTEGHGVQTYYWPEKAYFVRLN